MNAVIRKARQQIDRLEKHHRTAVARFNLLTADLHRLETAMLEAHANLATLIAKQADAHPPAKKAPTHKPRAKTKAGKKRGK